MHVTGVLSSEPFIPHSLQHLTEAQVFPSPLPQASYQEMIKEYEALEEVHTLRITYASDGLKITGIACIPKHIQPGKHALLIYNRGGNKEFGKLTLVNVLRSMAPFARQGYLVFASNYRGNDGGEGVEEFGGADVDDVTHLLAIARQQPGWDGKNAFMLGHSRGGMMTTLAIKNGAKLNAAICIAGVADLQQAAIERPELEERVYQKLIGNVEDRKQAYTDRSATQWPQALAATPFLLMHGDGDRSVDVSHSIRLAKALKSAGGICELVIYPTGSHALLRFWDDVLARSFAWMRRFSV